MISDNIVPIHRPIVGRVLVGKPVLADEWYRLGRLVHWLEGRGTQLVPMHRVSVNVQGTYTVRYYVPRSRRLTCRVWVFEVRSGVGSISAEGSASVPFMSRIADLPSVVHVPVSVPASSAEGEITATITSTGAHLSMVGVYEFPRYALSKSTEGGLSLDSFFPRRPIHDSSADGLSTGSLIRLAHSLTVPYAPRRIGHVGRYGNAALVTSISATSLTWTPYRVVPRRDSPGDTTKKLRARLFGSSNVSADWRVVVGSSGASAWSSLPLAVDAWTSHIDFDVNCEIASTVDGAPMSGMDTVDLQVRVNGVGQASIKGWVVYEND